MKTLLIIPAHNEQEVIKQTIKEVKSLKKYCDYLIINDCSNDNTQKILLENNANFIDLPLNLGLCNGVQTGFLYAYEKGYDCVIQYDSDGQHRPESVPLIIEEMKKGYDLVIGSRFMNIKPKQAGMSTPKIIGSIWIKMFIKLFSGQTIKDPTSGLRAFNKNLIKIMKDDAQLRVEPDTVFLLSKSGFKISEIQANILMERETGESYLKSWKAVSYMFHVTMNIILLIFKKIEVK